MVGEEVPRMEGGRPPPPATQRASLPRDDLGSDPAGLNRLRVPLRECHKGMNGDGWGQVTPCRGRSGADTSNGGGRTAGTLLPVRPSSGPEGHADASAGAPM